MKFPYRLSKERLSLLSKEDRAIYEYEHSSYTLLLRDSKYLKETAIEDDELLEDPTEDDIKSLASLDDSLSDADKEEVFNEFDDVLFEVFEEMLLDDLIECYGEDHIDEAKQDILKFYNYSLSSKNPLNEGTPGHDATFWLNDVTGSMGWLGKLAAGALTGVLGLAAWLLMKGRDRLAMHKLKTYMNKLVELTDQGINKKRPWYSFLMPKFMNKNLGEQNKTCLRHIQETAERNITCATMYACVASGLVNPDKALDARTGEPPQKGAGLDMFKKNIVNKINMEHV